MRPGFTLKLFNTRDVIVFQDIEADTITDEDKTKIMIFVKKFEQDYVRIKKEVAKTAMEDSKNWLSLVRPTDEEILKFKDSLEVSKIIYASSDAKKTVQFTSADLVDDKLTIAHGVVSKYPYETIKHLLSNFISVKDFYGNVKNVVANTTKLDDNTVEINLSEYILSGELNNTEPWTYEIDEICMCSVTFISDLSQASNFFVCFVISNPTTYNYDEEDINITP